MKSCSTVPGALLLGVVLLEPGRNHYEGPVATGEAVMPEALRLQHSEEPTNHPVLFR